VDVLAPSPGNSSQSARATAVTLNTDMQLRWDKWQWAVRGSSFQLSRKAYVLFVSS
jgi:hypothetical protein